MPKDIETPTLNCNIAKVKKLQLNVIGVHMGIGFLNNGMQSILKIYQTIVKNFQTGNSDCIFYSVVKVAIN